LREASKRHYAKLNLAHPDPLSADNPNLFGLITLCQLWSLHASADLNLGRSDRAFADIRVMHRLADVARGEPFLLSAILYRAIHSVALQAFWEGWVSDQWSVQQLEEFQKEFATVDMLAASDRGMRGERLRIIYMLETLDGRALAREMVGGATSGR